jgi:hypothetical protein
MIKNTLLICLLIFQIAITGCARNKQAEADQSCQQQISRVEQLQQQHADALDKGLNETINNLIVAAKIHAQHAQEILCIEKTQRALTLLEDSSTTKGQQN